VAGCVYVTTITARGVIVLLVSTPVEKDLSSATWKKG